MILGTLLKILISMLTSLLTEAFLKEVIVDALAKVVKLTATDLDDKLLDAAKKAWNVQD